MSTTDPVQLFEAARLQEAHDAAVAGLGDAPDDAELLSVAGRSALELGLDDAVTHLTALTRSRPDDPDAWRDLGFAAVEAGLLHQAVEAFRRVTELATGDATAHVHLAHALHASQRSDEAVTTLLRASEIDPSPAVLRSLADLARATGQNSTALDAATRLLERDTKDVLAALDAAELLLVAGRFGEAAKAFARLRTIDADEGHERYAAHGEIEARILAERWRPALDAAIDATRLDRHQLTTDLLAFVAAKLFGEAEREERARPWPDIQADLAAERAEHRRSHAEQEML